jgi:hypothetical protein
MPFSSLPSHPEVLHLDGGFLLFISRNGREGRKLKEIYHEAASVSNLMNKNSSKHFVSLMTNKLQQF